MTPNEPSPIFLPTRKWTPIMFELDDEWVDDEVWCCAVDIVSSRVPFYRVEVKGVSCSAGKWTRAVCVCASVETSRFAG